MKVVVVLPAYNCAKSLKKTISEIPQDVVNEIVLVDDFSSDDTLELPKNVASSISLNTTEILGMVLIKNML